MVIFHRYVKLPEGIPKHPPPMPVPMVGPTPAFHVFPDKLAQGPGENRMDKKKCYDYLCRCNRSRQNRDSNHKSEIGIVIRYY